VRSDIGKVLGHSLPKIVCSTNVKAAGRVQRFQDVDVMHKLPRCPPSCSASLALRRDAFALAAAPVAHCSRKRGLPRCSPKRGEGESG
jgi:hypothetical protein